MWSVQVTHQRISITHPLKICIQNTLSYQVEKIFAEEQIITDLELGNAKVTDPRK
jgi:hypothetical protein